MASFTFGDGDLRSVRSWRSAQTAHGARGRGDFLQPFIEAGDAGDILEVGKVHEALCERTGRRIHRSVTYNSFTATTGGRSFPPRHPRRIRWPRPYSKTGRTQNRLMKRPVRRVGLYGSSFRMKPGSDASTIPADAGPGRRQARRRQTDRPGIHLCPWGVLSAGRRLHTLHLARHGWSMHDLLSRHVRESFPDDFILMVYDGALATVLALWRSRTTGCS